MEKSAVTEKYDFSEILNKPCPTENGENPIRICFICTGNTCRSPMAAAVLNHLGKGKYYATSAGISAFNGAPISEDAVKALENAGIESTENNDYKNHRSRLITEEILKNCDKAVAMSERHMMSLLYAFPVYAEKIMVMSKNISDPYMLGQEEYRRCLDEITECIKAMFSL